MKGHLQKVNTSLWKFVLLIIVVLVTLLLVVNPLIDLSGDAVCRENAFIGMGCYLGGIFAAILGGKSLLYGVLQSLFGYEDTKVVMWSVISSTSFLFTVSIPIIFDKIREVKKEKEEMFRLKKSLEIEMLENFKIVFFNEFEVKPRSTAFDDLKNSGLEIKNWELYETISELYLENEYYKNVIQCFSEQKVFLQLKHLVFLGLVPDSVDKDYELSLRLFLVGIRNLELASKEYIKLFENSDNLVLREIYNDAMLLFFDESGKLESKISEKDIELFLDRCRGCFSHVYNLEVHKNKSFAKDKIHELIRGLF